MWQLVNSTLKRWNHKYQTPGAAHFSRCFRGTFESISLDTVDKSAVLWYTVHPHASGAPGGNQDMARTKGGLNTKIHLAVDAHGMPVRFLVTAGTVADCTQACALIDGVSAEYLLADRGYDSREVIEKALAMGMNVVIPPRQNRKEQRDYDRYLYKHKLRRRSPDPMYCPPVE